VPSAGKDSLVGWGSAYVLALVALFAYPAVMTAEIDPIERKLMARLRAGGYHAEDASGGGSSLRGCDMEGGRHGGWRGGDCADGARGIGRALLSGCKKCG